AEEETMDVQGAAAADPSRAGRGQSNATAVWALLEQATQMKTEGNAFYRDRNIRSAIGRYHRALLVLRGLDSEVLSSVKGFGPERPALTPEQEASLRNTQVDCYNNLAACLLQKQSVDYARVREYSLRVLTWRPDDVKALYRAGVAFLEMGDAQTAKHYLTKACNEQPHAKTDARVKKHLQRAQEKLDQELQKEKAMYRGMFSSKLKSD
uniref:Tetratricopeptide repeat domain 9C n=1 Tax=Tetraodon nigroviridis TaxID=99883 RepID=H3DHB0_TETNG